MPRDEMRDRDCVAQPTEVGGGEVDWGINLEPGSVLGDRYEIRSLLGAGGMGEVWHAFDLKLRVEVALKALRPELFREESRRELLRSEVRAAREVMSPNVCRIFDLVEVDGGELVSMEYVDGQTLLEVLEERGPLELKEAQDIASQFLAGLEAIHRAGLVHRDVKPENIMVTRTGRVVLMDFGLARQEAEGSGSVSGTPAYMAPEQAAGLNVDARADVYSAGVVLAEMAHPDGIKDLESRKSVWEGIRQEPARVPETPWKPVLKRAVARDPDQRYESAYTLTRELEEVTLRVEGAEDLTPYPGLAAFTEADAEYFFGREVEVERLWRRLDRPHLLAIVGPSGSGKTSFLRAGLIPSAAADWAIVRCSPGTAALASLRRALVSEIGSDLQAMGELAAGDADATVAAYSRWREGHSQALLIVDQFEELFTLNPPEEHKRFAELLGRLPLEADTHVLLSMRDDFLAQCNSFEALWPIFHELTMLDPPSGANLRRAVTQPAMKCGYRFEDDELVDELLAQVEGERGALPLLAFSMARMWEKRDRENGLMTRQAFEEIGGVGGALAQHAEATIDRIGSDRIPIVRELFRNLVTAEGTRAVREWEELLSVFDGAQRESAAEALRELVDARLLTSYEVKEEDQEPTRRVEIIHESLLVNWPRLVRWQTQDADAAQLRDQLRQAARTWHEHGHTDDTLWTGVAFREFASWRERYPGGLSELEEAFASAMTSLAARRRRRRRAAVTTIILVLLAGLAIVGTFWRRSVLETRRAEAAKLLALAQVQIDTDPTEALSFATSSLELSDTREARLFALKALWAGPPVMALDIQRAVDGMFVAPTFSPDGRWLAVAGIVDENVLVYGERGDGPIILGGHGVSASGPIHCGWTRTNLLVTGHWSENRVRVWSMPDGHLLNTIEFGERAWWEVGNEYLFAEVGPEPPPGEPYTIRLVRWKLPDGQAEDLGTVDFRAVGANMSLLGRGGSAWIYSKGNGVYSRSLPITNGVPDTLLGRHSAENITLGHWGPTDGFYSADDNGEIILWNHRDGTWVVAQRIRRPQTATGRLVPEQGGRWAKVGRLTPGPPVPLWDLSGPSDAEPVWLRRNTDGFFYAALHPQGRWFAAAAYLGRSEVTFWPLDAQLPIVIEGWLSAGFTSDGRYLVTCDWKPGQPATRVRLRPAPGNDRNEAVDLLFPPRSGEVGYGLTADRTGRRVLATAYGDTTFLLSANGDEPRNLFGFPSTDKLAEMGGFSPSGHLVAAATLISEGTPTLRVWDLETDRVRVFEQPEDPEAWEGYAAMYLAFVDETTLYTAGANGLLRWDLDTGTWEQLARAPRDGGLGMFVTADRREVLTYPLRSGWVRVPGPVTVRNLITGNVRTFDIPGEGSLGMSADGTVWVSGEQDGAVLVGQAEGGEPHILFGHTGTNLDPYVSPDSRWIATSGRADATLRLWPMPDLDKPPLHTLPHDELIAKLHSLTNLRAVRDEQSSTGWKIEVGPFPGWETVPTW